MVDNQHSAPAQSGAQSSRASDALTSRDVLRLIPLGGLGEMGMNCLAIEQADGILIVDCGVTFPSSDLGIDVFHPRFDYLFARSDRILGIVLTHGHEDHIGGLPYLLDTIDAPVFGPAHTLELAKQRLLEHGFDLGELDLFATKPGRPFEVGSFSVEPIRVTHSIADATALAIRTAAGLIVHTGDFKLDPDPPDGELTDKNRFRELGDEGVHLLLSDSTNVDSPGSSASERNVGAALDEIVGKARARVVIGIFASNVQRLGMIGEIARRTGRRICLLGRSVMNHVRAAETVGRLTWPSELVVPPEVAAAMPRERVLIIASGTQAERMSALTKLANGTHSHLRLAEGDLVVLSSRIIPGNDRPVFDMMAGFLRLGVELVTGVTDRRVHASGHAHRDEQLEMIELTRPHSFLPVHGTLHHLTRHAELARDAGVGSVMVAENGDVVEFGALEANTRIAKVARVAAGRIATSDGETIGDEVLRERTQLARSGAAFVSIVVNGKGAVVGAPTVVVRGVSSAHAGGALKEASVAVARAIAETGAAVRGKDADIVEVVRVAARRKLEALTGQRPVVVVALTRV